MANTTADISRAILAAQEAVKKASTYASKSSVNASLTQSLYSQFVRFASVWRGAWSSVTAYQLNDMVSYAGSSYIALQANINRQPNSNPSIWGLVAQSGAGGTTVSTDDGVSGDGSSGNPVKIEDGGITNAKLTAVTSLLRAADKIPLASDAGAFDKSWTPATLFTNERWVSPNGNDSDPGDKARPLKYLKTAWNQLFALGGGTIYFDDETYIADPAGSVKGLHIFGGAVTIPGAVNVMPVRVIGIANHTTSEPGFSMGPIPRLYGGAGSPSTDQDDPALWISDGGFWPMKFENVRFADGTNKSMRIGWNYYRNDSGDIVKSNVTHASRASGLTTLTLTPVDFVIEKISRTSDIVTVVMTLSGRLTPIRPGMYVHVNFTNGDFSPVDAVVTNIASDVHGSNAIQIASSGANFSAGAVDGGSIGTCSSHLMAVNDYLTLYSVDSEFPSSAYRVTAFDQTHVTIIDNSGYDTRSPTVAHDNIGTYAAQDRVTHPAERVYMSNIGARSIFIESTDRFVVGPTLDMGGIQFFDFNHMYLDGYNLPQSGPDFGCRDDERRAAVLCDGGSTGAPPSTGVFEHFYGNNGGVRYHCSSVAGGALPMKHILQDMPLSGVLPVPTVEILNPSFVASIYLEDITLADNPISCPAIRANGSTYGVVTVNGVFGTIEGPCHIINAGAPNVRNGGELPNSVAQSGYYSNDRLIAGRHMAAARSGSPITPALSCVGLVSQSSADWGTSGLVVTQGIRDPFGGTRAVRVTSAGDGNQLVFISRGVGDPTPVNGHFYCATTWMRGANHGNHQIALQVSNVAQTHIFLQAFADYPRSDSPTFGEWEQLTAGGQLTGVTGGDTDNLVVFVIEMNAGASIDIYMPTLFVQFDLTDVTSDELSELKTQLQPCPSYLNPGIAGTQYGQPFVAHGGLGTNAANAKVVGIGSGQLTLLGTQTYVPLYAADGITIITWIHGDDAAVNP